MNQGTQKKGILLVNLGSPERAEKGAIRDFLKEFLSDPRVMDIPALPRWLILNLFILPFRPRKIVEKYQAIWTEKGSPLVVHGHQLKAMVQDLMGPEVQVELAMRYGPPSLEDALERLRKGQVTQLSVLPLFPQYASATTGSVLEKLYQIVGKWMVIPEIKTINWFYDDVEFIQLWAELSREYLTPEPDRVLFSYHGLPERQIRNADCNGKTCLQSQDCCDQISAENATCYRAQCFHNTRLLAEALGIPTDKITVTFQSRLGKDPWIQPYTTETIRELAQQGVKNLLVFSPAFVTDCLETVEEIGIQEKKNFLEHGGESLTLVPSLNSHPKWAETVVSMIRRLDH